MKTAIITGGSGFVGSHLIRHLQREGRYDRIVNTDRSGLAPDEIPREAELAHLKWDVRRKADAEVFRELGCGEQTHIYNLAAICRIPGYPHEDYYRTNILGAENVCRLADELGCRTMLFTSSVSVYGGSEELKTEESVPQPADPYGISKLVAEYIHRGWRESGEGRRLVILRPGIIFGSGEQANFTRLYDALKKGYFFYPGRRDTRKACAYVKDVARALDWFARHGDEFELYNLAYEQAPAIEEICGVIASETDAGRARLRIPAPLLLGAAYLIHAAARLTGLSFKGIHPDRVRKVMVSTHISGEKLANSGFGLKYSLKEGVRDWFDESGRSLH
ncbi:MAG: NAD(P)-dependent oxidoreductase [Balneolaceae bacterium]|nr:NAD(P)-dependent oxidoreductase [Balneolaceae bacterium]